MRHDLKFGTLMPPFRWLIHGEWRTRNSGERYFGLALPSYGMHYDMARDMDVWSQRVLWWDSVHGFRLGWRPV